MKSEFTVGGMSCAACAHHVEAAVRTLPFVSTVTVSLITGTMTVQHEGDAAAIAAAVRRAGYTAAECPRGALTVHLPSTRIGQGDVVRLSLSILLMLLLLLLSMGEMLGIPRPSPLSPAEGGGRALLLTELLLATPFLWLGRRYFIRGAVALFRRAPTMDTLILLGAGTAFVHGVVLTVLALFLPEKAGVWAEAVNFEAVAMILTFVSVGKTLEGRARDKTADALGSLAALAPKTATLLKDGEEVTVPAESLVRGDTIVLRVGEAAPADGRVTEGHGSMNEAMLTGESLPVDKAAGDTVTAGCLLEEGRLLLTVEAAGEDTALSDILRMVSEAAAGQAPIARLADRVSAVFVPFVTGAALLTFLLFSLITSNPTEALRHAISVLVVSCPCALGLATPTAIMASTGSAARCGIFVKNAAVLEALGHVDTVAFDKTGTLTKGEMHLYLALPAEGIAEDTLLAKAAALEAGSLHPLAVAIREAAAERALPLPDCRNFYTVEGRGVLADCGEDRLFAGSADFLSQDAEIDITPLAVEGERLLAAGCSIVYIGENEHPLGVIGIADTPRPEAGTAVAALTTRKIRTVMLTGDNPRAAAEVARTVGITEVYAARTPEGKGEVIAALKEQGCVAMVGDGINDALPLVTADLGIAIGRGADVAVASADVVLRRSSLDDVVAALSIGRRTLRIIKQNLFWALLYNSLCIPAAAGVFLPLGIALSPGLSAAAMSLSSLFVVTNSLRLLRSK